MDTLIPYLAVGALAVVVFACVWAVIALAMLVVNDWRTKPWR